MTFLSLKELQQTSRRFFYLWLRFLARMIASLLFSYRTEGRHHLNVPSGAMLLSTHQSMMDPVFVGLASNRRLNYLARKTLFKNSAFAFLIKTLDAIEIDRDRGGLSGLKEMLKRLQRGELVLMFPEGTRTLDGKIGTIKPGFLPIARRSEVPLIPIAIVGAFECLPRGSAFPRRHPVSVVVGKPLLFEEYSSLEDDQLVHLIRERLDQLYQRGTELIHGCSH